MPKVVDLSLDGTRLYLKDVIQLIGFVAVVLASWYQIDNRLSDVERKISEHGEELPRDIRRGDLTTRVNVLNMELSYMEDRERSEEEQRKYEAKKALLLRLQSDLEELR